jgi:hypothetical protein
VTVTDRAQENREHVRTLLREKEPEFAALVDWPELNLPCLVGRDMMCAEPVTDWSS